MLGKKGNVMLEAAVVLPLILFIVIGLIFFPLSSFFTKTILVDAVREGARHVALYEDQEGARELVKQTLRDNGLDEDNLEGITFSYVTPGYVKVTADYRQPVLFPEVSALVGGERIDDFFILTVSSTFKREGP